MKQKPRSNLAVGLVGVLLLSTPIVGAVASPTTAVQVAIPAAAAPSSTSATQWRKGKTYSAGAVVKYKSKMWQADRRNRNKKPTSKSKYWTRVSGGFDGAAERAVGPGSVS